MAFGFQFVVVQSTMYRLVGEKRQEWDLPSPVGTITVHSASTTLANDSEVNFRGSGFESEAAARQAGEMFRTWLQIASALGVFGFDFGRDEPRSWLSSEARQQYEHDGMYVVDDVHGLLVFEERGNRPLRVALRASPVVQQSSERLQRGLEAVAGMPDSDGTVAFAAGLISLSDHIASATARFLTLVSAMKVLADRRAREGAAAALLGSFMEQCSKARASAAGAERNALDSLRGGLEDLRSQSISTAIRMLAAEARPADPDVVALANRIYACRSDLLHTGRADEDPRKLGPDTRALAIDMLKVRLGASPPTAA